MPTNLPKGRWFTAVVFSLTALCCSDHQPIQLRYNVERVYFQAERLARQAAETSGQTYEATISKAADTYSRSLQMSLDGLLSLDSAAHSIVWSELQYLAFESASRLVQIEFRRKQYDSCATVLNQLLARSPLTPHQNRISRFNLGQALQAGGRWDSAMSVYGTVLQEYIPPVDDSGHVVVDLIGLPSHLFFLTDTVSDPQRDMYFGWARDYYETLITHDPGTPAARLAHQYLAHVLGARKFWPETIRHLQVVAAADTAQTFSSRLRIAQILGLNPARHDEANQIYQQLAEGLDPADTLRLPLVRYNQARLQMHRQDLSGARQNFIEIKRKYPGFYGRTPAIQEDIARSFADQNNWSRAESEYRFLIERFYDSEQALSAYLYLADHYTAVGLSRETDRWLAEAETVYRELAGSGSPRVQARGRYYSARLTAYQGDLQAAIDQLTALFRDLPWTDSARNGLVWAIDTYRTELGLPAQADSLAAAMKSTLTRVETWEK
ncbi:MAG: tetratricopeptide repeat protein [bacterium]